MLNGGKISVGSGVMFSYGNQSPAVDAVPLAWTAGDVRQYMGGSDPMIVRYQCTVSGTPGTWVTVTAGVPTTPQILGKTNRSTATVYLDDVGTDDYIRWFPDVSGVAGSPVRRIGGAGLTDYSPIGGATPLYLGSYGPTVTVWDNGTPILSGSNNAVVYCVPLGPGEGFGWSSIADTVLRRLYCFLNTAGGSTGCLFTASLSGGGATPFTWTQTLNENLNVTLDYRASGPGQTLDCSLISIGGDCLPVLRAFALGVP